MPGGDSMVFFLFLSNDWTPCGQRIRDENPAGDLQGIPEADGSMDPVVDRIRKD